MFLVSVVSLYDEYYMAFKHVTAVAHHGMKEGV